MISNQKISQKLGCCVQIIDVGSQKIEKLKSISFHRQIIIGWELLSPVMTIGSQGQMIYKTYLMSWGIESPLRKDIERWNGGDLSEDQLRRFNLKSLLGQFHLLELVVTVDRADTSANENLKVAPLPTDIDQSTLPKPLSQFRIFMISEPDMEFFDQLPKEIQEKIRLSPEFEWAQKATGDDEYE